MDDKELKWKAEEWCLNHTFADTESAEGIRLQNAYIAGATENGNQWHDLKRNPDDVPKDCYIKQVYAGPSDGYTRAWYDKDSNRWISENGKIVWVGCIEQWCELPKLEE